MKVEEIKKLKSGKYKVKIGDEVITTYDDVILKNHLLFQKEITEETWKQIGIDNAYADIYHKTLNYLLRKVRSTKEVLEYLENFSLPDSEREKMINRLKGIGLLSDVAYAKAYISDSLYLTNDGPDKIQNHLYAEEIDESIILEEMAKVDTAYVQEKMEKLIQKRIQKDHKHSNYQLQQKIVMDMVNLGYHREDILAYLSQVTLKDDEKLEQEYERCYQKLSKKYEIPELFYKIKEKLYAKGFDIHDIEAYLDKKKSENF